MFRFVHASPIFSLNVVQMVIWDIYIHKKLVNPKEKEKNKKFLTFEVSVNLIDHKIVSIGTNI